MTPEALRARIEKIKSIVIRETYLVAMPKSESRTWALVRELLNMAEEFTALVAEARHDERAGLLRAYHVTLDGLDAPPDEWPCIRAKALVAKTRRERDERWIKALCPTCGPGHLLDNGRVWALCKTQSAMPGIPESEIAAALRAQEPA